MNEIEELIKRKEKLYYETVKVDKQIKEHYQITDDSIELLSCLLGYPVNTDLAIKIAQYCNGKNENFPEFVCYLCATFNTNAELLKKYGYSKNKIIDLILCDMIYPNKTNKAT